MGHGAYGDPPLLRQGKTLEENIYPPIRDSIPALCPAGEKGLERLPASRGQAALRPSWGGGRSCLPWGWQRAGNIRKPCPERRQPPYTGREGMADNRKAVARQLPLFCALWKARPLFPRQAQAALSVLARWLIPEAGFADHVPGEKAASSPPVHEWPDRGIAACWFPMDRQQCR